MQPTSDERRKVAERLRKDVGESSCIDYAVFRIAHEVMGIEDVTGAKAAHMLADLIDPTCRNTLPHNWGTFECSECGAQFYVSSVFMTESGNDDSEPIIPNYCPECGARVVSDDDASRD